MSKYREVYPNELYHYGIKGMKWKNHKYVDPREWYKTASDAANNVRSTVLDRARNARPSKRQAMAADGIQSLKNANARLQRNLRAAVRDTVDRKRDDKNKMRARADQLADINKTSSTNAVSRYKTEATARRNDVIATGQQRHNAEVRGRADAEARSRALTEARSRRDAEARGRNNAAARSSALSTSNDRRNAEIRGRADAEARSRALAEARRLRNAEARGKNASAARSAGSDRRNAEIRGREAAMQRSKEAERRRRRRNLANKTA